MAGNSVSGKKSLTCLSRDPAHFLDGGQAVPSCMRRRLILVVFSILLLGTRPSWGQDRVSRVQVAGGVGYLTSGDYFAGPGSTAFTNGNAASGTLEVGLRVHRFLDVVVAGAYAQPEWRLDGVPLIGSLNLPGARLWFGDVALR